MLFLPHDLTDKVETLPDLVLLDVDLPTVRGHGVKVLLDFEGYLLCELSDHLLESRSLESKVSILHNFHKLAVASLEKELALVF